MRQLYSLLFSGVLILEALASPMHHLEPVKWRLHPSPDSNLFHPDRKSQHAAIDKPYSIAYTGDTWNTAFTSQHINKRDTSSFKDANAANNKQFLQQRSNKQFSTSGPSWNQPFRFTNVGPLPTPYPFIQNGNPFWHLPAFARNGHIPQNINVTPMINVLRAGMTSKTSTNQSGIRNSVSSKNNEEENFGTMNVAASVSGHRTKHNKSKPSAQNKEIDSANLLFSIASKNQTITPPNKPHYDKLNEFSDNLTNGSFKRMVISTTPSSFKSGPSESLQNIFRTPSSDLSHATTTEKYTVQMTDPEQVSTVSPDATLASQAKSNSEEIVHVALNKTMEIPVALPKRTSKKDLPYNIYGNTADKTNEAFISETKEKESLPNTSDKPYERLLKLQGIHILFTNDKPNNSEIEKNPTLHLTASVNSATPDMEMVNKSNRNVINTQRTSFFKKSPDNVRFSSVNENKYVGTAMIRNGHLFLVVYPPDGIEIPTVDTKIHQHYTTKNKNTELQYNRHFKGTATTEPNIVTTTEYSNSFKSHLFPLITKSILSSLGASVQNHNSPKNFVDTKTNDSAKRDHKNMPQNKSHNLITEPFTEHDIPLLPQYMGPQLRNNLSNGHGRHHINNKGKQLKSSNKSSVINGHGVASFEGVKNLENTISKARADMGRKISQQRMENKHLHHKVVNLQDKLSNLTEAMSQQRKTHLMAKQHHTQTKSQSVSNHKSHVRHGSLHKHNQHNTQKTHAHKTKLKHDHNDIHKHAHKDQGTQSHESSESSVYKPIKRFQSPWKNIDLSSVFPSLPHTTRYKSNNQDDDSNSNYELFSFVAKATDPFNTIKDVLGNLTSSENSSDHRNHKTVGSNDKALFNFELTVHSDGKSDKLKKTEEDTNSSGKNETDDILELLSLSIQNAARKYDLELNNDELMQKISKNNIVEMLRESTHNKSSDLMANTTANESLTTISSSQQNEKYTTVPKKQILDYSKDNTVAYKNMNVFSTSPIPTVGHNETIQGIKHINAKKKDNLTTRNPITINVESSTKRPTVEQYRPLKIPPYLAQILEKPDRSEYNRKQYIRTKIVQDIINPSTTNSVLHKLDKSLVTPGKDLFHDVVHHRHSLNTGNTNVPFRNSDLFSTQGHTRTEIQHELPLNKALQLIQQHSDVLGLPRPPRKHVNKPKPTTINNEFNAMLILSIDDILSDHTNLHGALVVSFLQENKDTSKS